MAKKIQALVKLQCPAGAATPAPPVGTALGPHGVNIMEFVKQFNARTQSQSGMVIPVRGDDLRRSHLHLHHQDPAGARTSCSRRRGSRRGAASPTGPRSGKVTRAQVKKIAEIKMADLNASDLDSAMRMIAGTARSMGLEVVD